MKFIHILVWALVLGLFSNLINAQVVTIRVGDGPNCSTNNIQSAINSAPPPPAITQILIARTRVYNVASLDINSKNIFLYGGYADCNQVQFDSIRTEISGAGGAVASVLVIRGATSQVGIYNLAISDGDEDNTSYGGGVDIREGPHALVYFQNTSIFNNRAGLGGGLSVRNSTPANQAAVKVVVGSNSSISSNQSLAGGGIYCENSTLDIKGLNISIFNNQAGTTNPPLLGNGGGLNLQNCISKIGTTSLIGNIANNIATNNGGGILAAGAQMSLAIYTVDAFNPVRIIGNTAQNFGGAIAVDDDADVRLYAGIIDNNRAYNGGGAINVFDEGTAEPAVFTMVNNQFSAGTGDFDRSVLCDVSIAAQCNRISNNKAIDALNQVRPGAVTRTTASLGQPITRLNRTRVFGNVGDSLSFSSGDSASISGLSCQGCLIHGNQVARYLFNFEGFNGVELNTSTVANNTVGIAVVRHANYAYSIRRSIVFESVPMAHLASEGTYAPFRKNILSSAQNINVQDVHQNLVTDPKFVAPLQADFSLRSDSPALDYLDAINNEAAINSSDRVIDLPNVNNVYGPQDAGAYEMPLPAEFVFRNGFE
jgi:predicted outer membrane repeat protein